VVDNGAKAKKALKREGYSCYEEIVLHTTLPNVPGALAQFVKKLAAKNINIGGCYQTTVEGSKNASVVLAVSHLEVSPSPLASPRITHPQITFQFALPQPTAERMPSGTWHAGS